VARTLQIRAGRKKAGLIVNKIFLIGNLTRDPELRTTGNGISVCSFGLAVNRRRKVEGQPDVDFFNVNAWRQLGETCARYLSKGRKVCVVGSIQLRNYETQDGAKRTSVDVVADEVEFLNAAPPQSGGEAPAHHAPRAETPPQQPAGESGFTQVDDDELPF